MSLAPFDPLLSVITSMAPHQVSKNTTTTTNTNVTDTDGQLKQQRRAKITSSPVTTTYSSYASKKSKVTKKALLKKVKKKKPAHKAPSAAMATPCTWTNEESAALKIAVDVHKSKNWKKIVLAVRNVHSDYVHTDTSIDADAGAFPQDATHHSTIDTSKLKTEEQCMAHWRNVLCPPIVKGKGSWTPEEDQNLQSLVEIHGRTKWSFIGKFLPGRVGKQCRERW